MTVQFQTWQYVKSETMSNEKLRVIVVDDDFDTVEIFSEYLQLKGISVVGKGYGGSDAITLYANLRPDILFLDVMMPNVNGIKALEEIRKLDPGAKVIMVTADSKPETREKLEKLNATAILEKPFDMNELIITIQQTMKDAITSQILM